MQHTPRLCTSTPEVPTPAHHQFAVPMLNKPFFRVMSATARRPSLCPSPPSPKLSNDHHTLSSRKSSGSGSGESVLLATSTYRPVQPQPPPTMARTASIATRPSTAHSDFRRSWVLTRHVEAPPCGGGITTPRRTPRTCSNATPMQTILDRKGKWAEHGLPPPSASRPSPRTPTHTAGASSPARSSGLPQQQADDDDVMVSRVALHDLDWFDDKLITQVTPPTAPQGSVANLKALTSSTRDYYLTRTLFHAQMLSNLHALRSMQSVPEEELARRIEVLRGKFASRLGRHDFHQWLSELVQTHVPRLESDTIFDSFDENKSGSVDEEEFIVGVQTVLRGRDRGLINFIRKLLGDVRATVGTVMNEIEVFTLLDVIGRVSRRRYPDIDHAIAVVKRSIKDFTQQAQIPTTEFCRALQVSPLISKVLDVLQEDGQLPPSPPPPPTPDPDRDIARVPRVEAPPPVPQAPEGDGLNSAASGSFAGGTFSTMEAILTRPPPRKKPASAKPKATPVLGKLDIQHPGFRADACINARRFEDRVTESTDAEWFIRNGVVWCRTDQGEVPKH